MAIDKGATQISTYEIWEQYTRLAHGQGSIVQRRGDLYSDVHLPHSHQRAVLKYQTYHKQIVLYKQVKGYWRSISHGLEAILEFEEAAGIPPIHEQLGLQVLYLDADPNALSEEALR